MIRFGIFVPVPKLQFKFLMASKYFALASYYQNHNFQWSQSISVGPKSGGSSDTSPPLQSFAEESSPENLMPSRMVNGQSTESLDSLSDESGGVHHSPGGVHHSSQPSRQSRHNARSTSGTDLRNNVRNPVPPPRQVWAKKRLQIPETKVLESPKTEKIRLQHKISNQKWK